MAGLSKWLRYEHIKSCMAGHKLHVNGLFIHGFWPVNALLFKTYGFAFSNTFH